MRAAQRCIHCDGVLRRLCCAVRRRRGVASSLLATIVANLSAFLTGALAVQIQADLGFGDAALGLAIGCYYVVGAIAAPWTGHVVERIGAQRSLRGAAALSALTLLAIATGARSFGVLLALMAVGGLANSWAQPAANVYLARIVSPGRLGLALGVQKSAIPAAALLGGLAVPLAQQTGWRWAFVASAVVAAIGVWSVPTAPRHVGDRPRRRREGSIDVPISALVILAAGVGLGSSASNAMSAFVVRGGVEAGLGEGSAAALLVVGSVFGIALRLGFGARADRRPGHTISAMAQLFAAAAAAFVLLATEIDWLFVVAIPLAFTTAYGWPGLFHLTVVRSNPSAPGKATGIAMTGTLAGAVVGPVVFGIIAEHGSYHAAWLSAAGLLALACCTLLVARRQIVEIPPAAASGGGAGAPWADGRSVGTTA